MNFSTLRRYAPQIQQIAIKYGIAKVFVFGSTARGEASAQSDIDLLVEMQEGVSLFGVGGFLYEVETLLGVRVDVVPMSVLPQISDGKFRKSIQEDAVAL